MIHRNCIRGLLFVSTGVTGIGGLAFAKTRQHHSGKQLLDVKFRTDGVHVIDKTGKHTVAVRVANGKVAGLHVKHANSADMTITKYKTKQQFAQAANIELVLFSLSHYQDLGMTYIGYAFIDEFGNENIYWFPYEMIFDGDTGAVIYVQITEQVGAGQQWSRRVPSVSCRIAVIQRVGRRARGDRSRGSGAVDLGGRAHPRLSFAQGARMDRAHRKCRITGYSHVVDVQHWRARLSSSVNQTVRTTFGRRAEQFCSQCEVIG